MLIVDKVAKTFRLDGDPLNDRQALKGVSLTVGDHDFVALIGGNGSGKSTLLNIIAGSLRPDAGTLSLDGKDLSGLPEWKRASQIARVFQDPSIGSIGDMTLEENLALASRRGRRHGLRWYATKEDRAQFRALLAPLGLGLEKRLTQRMRSFSGGERQTITLLMASFNEPRLLLLDEHTAALDPKTAASVMELTDRLVRDKGMPTLMITHNMKDAIRYGNRLLMMEEGEIVYEAEGEAKKNLRIEDLVARFAEMPD